MELGDNSNFQTSEWVIDLMIDEIPQDMENNILLEPTPGAGGIVKRLEYFNRKVLFPNNNYFDMEHNTRYGCIIGNPPFSPMKKGYQILYDLMNHSDNIILVMPWLTLINGQKRLNDIMEYGLKKIIHLPRSAFKGARVQTCIIVMQKGFKGETIFKKSF